MEFKELNICDPILKALQEEGYEAPTPIQEKAIPVLLKKRDLLGCAQTGTGKTAAFAIPILQMLREERDQLAAEAKAKEPEKSRPAASDAAADAGTASGLAFAEAAAEADAGTEATEAADSEEKDQEGGRRKRRRRRGKRGGGEASAAGTADGAAEEGADADEEAFPTASSRMNPEAETPMPSAEETPAAFAAELPAVSVPATRRVVAETPASETPSPEPGTPTYNPSPLSFSARRRMKGKLPPVPAGAVPVAPAARASGRAESSYDLDELDASFGILSADTLPKTQRREEDSFGRRDRDGRGDRDSRGDRDGRGDGRGDGRVGRDERGGRYGRDDRGGSAARDERPRFGRDDRRSADDREAADADSGDASEDLPVHGASNARDEDGDRRRRRRRGRKGGDSTESAVDAGPVVERNIRALVLTPTRELALQVEESFETYGRHMGLSCTVVYGGVRQGNQVAALKKGVDILVATPGRLLDLVGQRLINLHHIRWLVLDEADRMLDMGFAPDVKRIIGMLPKIRQTMLFSATMPLEIMRLVETVLDDPEEVSVTPIASTVDTIEQYVYHVNRINKRHLLVWLLQKQDIRNVLVFSKTKHGADRIGKDLESAGIQNDVIHGDKPQSARQQALNDFKRGRIRVLVATDIAARGIDVDGLSHVINFDMPDLPESYVHRIGRTGRAGQAGIALSFCDDEERPLLRDIRRLTKSEIVEVTDHPFALESVVEVEDKPKIPFAGKLGKRRGRRPGMRSFG